jgi:hypothetical protein
MKPFSDLFCDRLWPLTPVSGTLAANARISGKSPSKMPGKNHSDLGQAL